MTRVCDYVQNSARSAVQWAGGQVERVRPQIYRASRVVTVLAPGLIVGSCNAGLGAYVGLPPIVNMVNMVAYSLMTVLYQAVGIWRRKRLVEIRLNGAHIYLRDLPKYRDIKQRVVQLQQEMLRQNSIQVIMAIDSQEKQVKELQMNLIQRFKQELDQIASASFPRFLQDKVTLFQRASSGDISSRMDQLLPLGVHTLQECALYKAMDRLKDFDELRSSATEQKQALLWRLRLMRCAVSGFSDKLASYGVFKKRVVQVYKTLRQSKNQQMEELKSKVKELEIDMIQELNRSIIPYLNLSLPETLRKKIGTFQQEMARGLDLTSRRIAVLSLGIPLHSIELADYLNGQLYYQR